MSLYIVEFGISILKCYITITSVFIECVTSDARACDIYNVDEILSQPVNDGIYCSNGYCFPERNSIFFLFLRCIIVKQKILFLIMHLYASNNEQSRITVELKAFEINS